MLAPVQHALKHVVVFAPYVEEDGRLVSPHYDLPEYRSEIGGWMTSLGLSWEWKPVTARNLAQVLADLRETAPVGETLVFNLCDGSDSDGYPGVEVVEALEREGIPFTGADPYFYRLTTAKSDMKAVLRQKGVSTAASMLIGSDEDIAHAVQDIGFPLFIKPDVSAGSYGIQVDSVCYDRESARRKVSQLREGLHGQTFDASGIMAERFIEGREFTVLAVEDPAEPMGLWILPPGERVFDKRVPSRERFLAFERYWALPEEERPIPEGQPYYWYASAPAEWRAQLEDLARRAMRAVGGTGYGRVDIRLDEASGVLYVLEVNAQCGLSSDDSSTVGSMLRLAGENVVNVIARVLQHGMNRNGGRVPVLATEMVQNP
jgi:D-alanine-D-alanine ligase